MNEQRDNGQTQESLDVVPMNTLGTLVQAEIDVQVATAKRYPRSIASFKKTALAMATLNEEIAASCFYTLPRSGKPITGPSVRLAEICALAWGNVRFGARVISDDGKSITAQGACHDLERNVAGTIEVKRRITTKSGARFSDDMVVVTGNAACAIAKRNAILGVVPLAYVKEIEMEARKAAIGDAKTLAAKRADMVAYFGKMGVEPERVFAAVGKTAIEDVGLEELGILKGYATSIRDSEMSVDETFPPLPAKTRPGENGANRSKADTLEDKLAGKAQQPEKKQEAKPSDAEHPTSPQHPEGTTPAQDDAEAQARGDRIFGRPTREQLSQLSARFVALGWSSDEASEYLERAVDVGSVEALNYEQASKAIADLDSRIAEQKTRKPAKASR